MSTTTAAAGTSPERLARVPLTHPRTLLVRLVEAWSRRRYGAVLEPGLVALHNRRVLTTLMRTETGAARWNALDPTLKALATLAAAAQIGCSWCLDFGYWQSRQDGIAPAKLAAVPRWRDAGPDVFDERERAVLAFHRGHDGHTAHGGRRPGRRAAPLAGRRRPGRARRRGRAGEPALPHQRGDGADGAGLPGPVRPRGPGLSVGGDEQLVVPGDGDAAAELFAAHRGAVVGAAYRVLGSLADAEDVTQETWLRWAAARPVEIEHPRAYLVRIGTRLALNRLRQLHRQREEYVGPWLPEPVDDLSRVGVEGAVELADSVSYAMLVLLAALSPVERAAFVLHEVFGVPYGEVAASLDRSEAAVRQLVHRARTHLRDRSPRHPVDRRTHAAVTDRFLQATRDGALAPLVELLAPEVVLVSDGGGRRAAALRPLVGRDKVLRFAAGVLAKPEAAGLEVRGCTVNGQPAIGLYARQPDGTTVVDSVCVLVVDGGLVTSVLLLRNPDKLTGVSA